MLRLVGDGQHKLMRKRLRKVAMQVGMKVMELKKGWRKEMTTVLLNSGWLILLTTHRDIIIYLVVCVSQHPSGCPEYCPRKYYTIQHSADPVNREKGNITHIGLLEADEDKILVAQVSPKGSTCA